MKTGEHLTSATFSKPFPWQAEQNKPFSHQTQSQTEAFSSPLHRAALQGFAISVSLLPAGSSVRTAALPEGHF